ncbi:hypothetical protein [Roseiarcus fermentans]|nr:hypothetical protein [Roseiarcus fermentans]
MGDGRSDPGDAAGIAVIVSVDRDAGAKGKESGPVEAKAAD